MFNIDKIVQALQSDPNKRSNALSGAAGLAAGMLLGGGAKGLGGAAKMGAVAAIGGLAYNAWQKHQQTNGGSTTSTQSQIDAFVNASSGGDELGKSIVRAMIAAAKADGHIDANERQRIFKQLEEMDLSADEKAFVFQEMDSPLDIGAVVAGADTLEHAFDIYTASLIAMDADTPEEKAYLAELAYRLNLENEVVASIHEQAGKGAPQFAALGNRA